MWDSLVEVDIRNTVAAETKRAVYAYESLEALTHAVGVMKQFYLERVGVSAMVSELRLIESQLLQIKSDLAQGLAPIHAEVTRNHTPGLYHNKGGRFDARA